MGVIWKPSDRLAVELRRVGVSMRAAETTMRTGVDRGLQAYEIGGNIYVDAPSSDLLRQRWGGSEGDLLMVLAQLSDGAGTEACWALLKGDARGGWSAHD